MAFTGRAVPAPLFYNWMNDRGQSKELKRILSALSPLRLGVMPLESDIHAHVARALEEGGLAFTHEMRLDAHRRIDFLCEGVGIEIKKGRPQPAALKKQIAGYLQSPLLKEILVITQRSVRLPDQIGDKHVCQLSLDRLWGIAL